MVVPFRTGGVSGKELDDAMAVVALSDCAKDDMGHKLARPSTNGAAKISFRNFSLLSKCS